MPGHKTLPEMLLEGSTPAGVQTALHDRINGSWQATTHGQLRERVSRLAAGLDARGIKKGEPIGLLIHPSVDWLVVDLAIQLAGGVSVPFFVDFSEDHAAYKIRDSGLRTLFVFRQELWTRFAPLVSRVRAVISDQPLEGVSQFVPLALLSDEGSKRLARRPGLSKEQCAAVKGDSLATILYTSGSTGDPKGVELTQRNLLSQLAGMQQWFHFVPGEDVALSFLPLAHAFERVVMYFYLQQRIDVYFADDVHRLSALLQDVRPTMMTTVPRVLEKIHDRMWEKANAAVGWRRSVQEWVLQSASQSGGGGGLGQKLATEILHRRVNKGMGGRLRIMVTGGAALRPDLYDFYVRLGVPIYQGYGLTEASPIISTNAPDRHRIGTVGQPLPGVEVEIGSDGEVLARGPNVMRGYHNRPEDTARVIDTEGWLHTGDMGHLDSDGFLTIEARKKELFKTSTGEYVSPVSIEQVLCRSPLVDMACVVAEGRKCVVCLLFVNRDTLTRMKQSEGATTQSLEQFLAGPVVQGAVNELIRKVNEPLDPWARIRRHALLLDVPSIAGGELTPTMKLCRHVIERKYADLLNSLYRETLTVENG